MDGWEELAEELGLGRTEARIVLLLLDGPRTLKELSLRLDVHYQTVVDTLRRLRERGDVIRLGRGVYYVGPSLLRRLVKRCTDGARVD